MKPSGWPAALAATLVGLVLLPAAAVGAPPERVLVCHVTADAAPDAHPWNLLEVSIKSLDKHLAHGDGTPGGEVPGSSGVAFDEDCIPQHSDPDPDGDPEPEPDPDPDPEPSELVFAVAYSDMDGSDGGYDPDVDVLIAKLIDGPGDANDGIPGAGDLIITHGYPMDFGATTHGEFTVTEHIVTGLSVGRSYLCNVQSDDNMFVWSSGQGSLHLYHESVGATKTEIADGIPDMGDAIQVSSSSPSQPASEVALLSGSDVTDQTFIDVEADCPIAGE